MGTLELGRQHWGESEWREKWGKKLRKGTLLVAENWKRQKTKGMRDSEGVGSEIEWRSMHVNSWFAFKAWRCQYHISFIPVSRQEKGKRLEQGNELKGTLKTCRTTGLFSKEVSFNIQNRHM